LDHLGGRLLALERAVVGTAFRPTSGLQTFGHADELSTFSTLSTFPKVDDSLLRSTILPTRARCTVARAEGVEKGYMRIAVIVLALVLATRASAEQLAFRCDGVMRDYKSLREKGPVRDEVVE